MPRKCSRRGGTNSDYHADVDLDKSPSPPTPWLTRAVKKAGKIFKGVKQNATRRYRNAVTGVKRTLGTIGYRQHGKFIDLKNHLVAWNTAEQKYKVINLNDVSKPFYIDNYTFRPFYKAKTPATPTKKHTPPIERVDTDEVAIRPFP